MTDTVLVLGAGATKAAGGPLTCEILHDALTLPNPQYPELLQKVDEFLVANFHLHPDRAMRVPESYPNLPLLLSLIDVSIDRKQPLAPNWPPERLEEVRAALEYAIFVIVDNQLNRFPTNQHYEMMRRFADDAGPTVISLNYDLVADNAMISASGGNTFPDYAIEVATPRWINERKWGTLLKLHGSISWLYCPNCHDLAVELAPSMRGVAPDAPVHDPGAAVPCARCGGRVRPVLITPTYRKDYRNPHIARIWQCAESVLRDARRIVFIGYSLPDDDVEVVYMLKRAISPTAQITVVEMDNQNRPMASNEVGRRYQCLFGATVEWNPNGLDAWLAH
jgi:hypothetical protein